MNTLLTTPPPEVSVDLAIARCGPVTIEGELRYRHEQDLNNTLDYKESLLCARTEAALLSADNAPAMEQLLRDLTQLASEYNDHTSASFGRGVLGLALRAHKLLAPVAQPIAPPHPR